MDARGCGQRRARHDAEPGAHSTGLLTPLSNEALHASDYFGTAQDSSMAGPSTPTEQTASSSAYSARRSPPPAPRAPNRHFYLRRTGQDVQRQGSSRELHFDEDVEVASTARLLDFNDKSPLERPHPLRLDRSKSNELDKPDISSASLAQRKMLGSPVRMTRNLFAMGDEHQHQDARNEEQDATSSNTFSILSSLQSPVRKHGLTDVLFDAAEDEDRFRPQATSRPEQGASGNVKRDARHDRRHVATRKQPLRACTKRYGARRMDRPTLRPLHLQGRAQACTRPLISSPLSQTSELPDALMSPVPVTPTRQAATGTPSTAATSKTCDSWSSKIANVLCSPHSSRATTPMSSCDGHGSYSPSAAADSPSKAQQQRRRGSSSCLARDSLSGTATPASVQTTSRDYFGEWTSAGGSLSAEAR